MRTHLLTALAGVLLGYFLSNIGFSSWDEVHRMFTLQSLRMIFAFLTAAVILMVAWRVIARTTSASWSPRLIHPGTVWGGIIFGAGWALCGACPSIAFVQLGEAQLGAVVSLGGMFVGNWLYSVCHERYFRWTMRNCVDN